MTPRGVVFDYSGTLSLGAVFFSRPGRLMKELRRSGLEELGITTPDVFWDRIVNPTWEEGSTTAVGYKTLMARRIAEIFGHKPSVALLAVSRFVDAYLEQSKIDPRWRPLLKTLAADSSAKTIIATDHYAEATDLIVGSLTRMGICAVSVRDARRQTPAASFLVANSADIGFPKATGPYWEKVKGVLAPERVEALLIVDDFGANEQEDDSYGGEEKVAGRRQGTVDTLRMVFAVEVQAFPFIPAIPVPGGGVDDKSYGTLIGEASARVARYLEQGK